MTTITYQIPSRIADVCSRDVTSRAKICEVLEGMWDVSGDVYCTCQLMYECINVCFELVQGAICHPSTNNGAIHCSSRHGHPRISKTVSLLVNITYSRSNSTKFPASGACNVSEPRLTSQVRKVREVVCA
jgi:hypothetical protein